MIRLPTHRAPTHPGEVLKEDYLEPLALSRTEVARRLEIPLNRLNEIINGRRGMTADTALRLERAFGTSAGFWLNLQQAYELWQAQHRTGWKSIRRFSLSRTSDSAVESSEA